MATIDIAETVAYQELILALRLLMTKLFRVKINALQARSKKPSELTTLTLKPGPHSRDINKLLRVRVDGLDSFETDSYLLIKTWAEYAKSVPERVCVKMTVFP
ncbi:unnamed protein product, partial [Mesorhabditis spiculigera]